MLRWCSTGTNLCVLKGLETIVLLLGFSEMVLVAGDLTRNNTPVLGVKGGQGSSQSICTFWTRACVIILSGRPKVVIAVDITREMALPHIDVSGAVRFAARCFCRRYARQLGSKLEKKSAPLTW